MTTQELGPADLTERLARLEAAEAARTLAYRYAKGIDTLDYELVRSLFTDDAVLVTSRGEYAGPEAIVAFFRDRHESSPATKRHYLVNLEVAHSAPGEVTMSSYFWYTNAAADVSLIGWGSYEDDVVVTDGVARFRRRSISVDVAVDVREGWASP